MITHATRIIANESIASESIASEVIAGEIIQYDFFVSRFGHGLIAGTSAGICDITFADAPHAELVHELEQQNSNRQIIHAPGRFAADCREMFSRHESDCVLDLRGSAFQIEVWSELRQIPVGQTVSYQQLAQRVGRPRAVRAVASAVAKNRIAFLVPCHRVIRTDGTIGGYRWGVTRKAEMLDWESITVTGTVRANAC